jgi:hypothetical protein
MTSISEVIAARIRSNQKDVLYNSEFTIGNEKNMYTLDETSTLFEIKDNDTLQEVQNGTVVEIDTQNNLYIQFAGKKSYVNVHSLDEDILNKLLQECSDKERSLLCKQQSISHLCMHHTDVYNDEPVNTHSGQLPVQSPTINDKKKSSSNRSYIIPLLVVTCIFIGGLIIYFVTKPSYKGIPAGQRSSSTRKSFTYVSSKPVSTYDKTPFISL